MRFYALAALLAPHAYAHSWTLYASTNNTVHTLKLSTAKNATGNASYAFTDVESLAACGKAPSWLTLARGERTLYCADESLPGGISAIKLRRDGRQAPAALAPAIGGDVHSDVYRGADGTRFLAVADYVNASITTYRLPLTNASKPAQVLGPFKLAQPGPAKGRQEAAHPHQVLADPSSRFLVAPDLGADLVRVYAILCSGQLQECPPFQAKPGSGPRHAAFKKLKAPSGGNATLALYLASELTAEVSFLRVTPPVAMGACPTLTEVNRQSNFPPGATYNKTAASTAEVRARGRHVWVSNRGDGACGPGQDSITAWTAGADGTLSAPVLGRAGGSAPRTFALSRRGRLVAIGNQGSGAVVIAKRDAKTGQVGPAVGSLTLAPPGSSGMGGVTSVVWGPEKKKCKH